MLLGTGLFQGVDEGLGVHQRIHVPEEEGVVRVDDHDRRIQAHGDALGDGVAAAITADHRIFHAVGVDPLLALAVVAVRADPDEIDVVFVAAE